MTIATVDRFVFEIHDSFAAGNECSNVGVIHITMVTASATARASSPTVSTTPARWSRCARSGSWTAAMATARQLDSALRIRLSRRLAH